MFHFPQSTVIFKILFFYTIHAEKLIIQLFSHFASLHDLTNEHKIII